MRISIIPDHKIIQIDEIPLKCVYSVSPNIDSAFFDDIKKEGVIQYKDKPNAILTSLPNINNLIDIYWDTYAIKKKPSEYHTFDSETHTFFISPENQIIKDADEAEAQAAKAEKEAEEASNPLSNITYEQAETWIDNNVIDLNSAKQAMKKIVRLIILRTSK